MPFECHDFCWTLSHTNSSSKDQVMIQNDNDRGIVMLATIDRDLTALSTRWNQMYTVVKFWWGNRSYRWMMSWMTVGNSMNHLKIQLLQDACPHPLACIEGPGCQRKQFWVQLNKPDTISLFCDIQDPMWLQVIIASGLVAVKVQRRRDKAMPAALRRRLK
ncbi:TPA: hypothetical protein ACH3X2_000654 [Trebouxia sp. C0005]